VFLFAVLTRGDIVVFFYRNVVPNFEVVYSLEYSQPLTNARYTKLLQCFSIEQHKCLAIYVVVCGLSGKSRPKAGPDTPLSWNSYCEKPMLESHL